jgi:hypothetical protein
MGSVYGKGNISKTVTLKTQVDTLVQKTVSCFVESGVWCNRLAKIGFVPAKNELQGHSC